MGHDTPPVAITARRDGYRRFGIAHSTTPRRFEAGRWSPAELAILRADPGLIVVDMPAAPPGQPARPQTVEEAIERLDPDDPTLWTSSGLPRVEALEELLGRDVSAAERDEAWAWISARG